MPPSSAFEDEPEMFDGIRHIQLRTIDLRLCQRLIQHLADRDDKRFAGQIFLVAWLFAHQPDAGIRRATPRTVCVAARCNSHLA